MTAEVLSTGEGVCQAHVDLSHPLGFLFIWFVNPPRV